MAIKYPLINKPQIVCNDLKRLLITAYGFEDRTLGWSNFQIYNSGIINAVLSIRYKSPKGQNKISELKTNFKRLGVTKPIELIYYINGSDNIENKIDLEIEKNILEYDEIILDISSLTKFLILIFLSKLQMFKGNLRIVYTEAASYAPSEEEYKSIKTKINSVINFPTKGFGRILRAKCISSIRMQGQPVTLVAFTSFNEQLVRHMLGTISPHNLIFINGRPPGEDNIWREEATLYLHMKLINEYQKENKINQNKLERTTSTLNYEETIKSIEKIYDKFGLYERIIIAATGSKMQTVGLLFAKIKHPDIHIEYPTPDSYYIKGFSAGIGEIHEICFSNFNLFISSIQNEK